MQNGISVIICCYNSEKRIPSVLEHLEAQKGTEGFPWEIIVVDNASSDQTAAVARKSWTRKDVHLQVVFESTPGLSNARRKGLSEAKHEIIVFVDDDNLLSDNYIFLAQEIMMAHQEVGLAGGLGTAVSPVPLPHWFDEFQFAYAVGEQASEEGFVPKSRTYLHGAGIVMRKSAWDYIISKGFTFHLSGRKGKSLSSGEDSEISYAFRLAGFRLWYSPRLTFKHVISENRLEWSYLKNLIKAFGRTWVVLEPYAVHLNRSTKGKMTFRDSWLYGMLATLSELLRKLPAYLSAKIRQKEGSRDETRFMYRSGAMLQWFAVLGHYSDINRAIIAFEKKIQDSNQIQKPEKS